MLDIMDLYPDQVIPEPNSGCWLCASNNNGFGYAQFKLGGRRVSAHRLSYELSIGRIPEGFEVDHRCRLTCCVNPDHLEAVTQFENKRRANRDRERDAEYRCPNGHPRTPDNIYTKPNGRRQCRQCMTDARARSRQRAVT